MTLFLSIVVAHMFPVNSEAFADITGRMNAIEAVRPSSSLKTGIFPFYRIWRR